MVEESVQDFLLRRFFVVYSMSFASVSFSVGGSVL